MFFIIKCLGRCDHDGLTCVDTHGIDILHVTYYDTCIIRVPHDLVLELLPAQYTFFYKHLADATASKSSFSYFQKLLAGTGYTASGTSQRIGRPDDKRQSQLINEPFCFCKCGHCLTAWHLFTDALHCFLEQFTVLSVLNSLERCAQQFYAELLEDAHLSKLTGYVKTRLATYTCNNAIGPLLFNDLGYCFWLKWLYIDSICHFGICHNSSRVGVDQHHLQSLFLKGPACLAA